MEGLFASVDLSSALLTRLYYRRLATWNDISRFGRITHTTNTVCKQLDMPPIHPENRPPLLHTLRFGPPPIIGRHGLLRTYVNAPDIHMQLSVTPHKILEVTWLEGTAFVRIALSPQVVDNLRGIALRYGCRFDCATDSIRLSTFSDIQVWDERTRTRMPSFEINDVVQRNCLVIVHLSVRHNADQVVTPHLVNLLLKSD